MWKPTKRKIAVFIGLLALTLGPALLFGSGPGLIVPMFAMFWLDMVGKEFGIPVAVNGGVDAFSLVPPTVLGYILIGVGSLLSVAGLYALASVLARKQTAPPHQ